MATKECKACGVEKEGSEENFYKVYGNRDGLDGTCKACRIKRREDVAAGKGPPKGSRLQMIKNRHAALKQDDTGDASVPATPTTPVLPAPTSPPLKAKPRKKRKARKMAAKGHPFILESDRLITEMVDVANVIKNGKVLLRQKCEQLLAALDAEGHGQGHD